MARLLARHIYCVDDLDVAAMKTKRWAGFRGYLNQQETAAIIRWAHSELETLRNSGFKGSMSALSASLSFYEGLILKLEGHKDDEKTEVPSP